MATQVFTNFEGQSKSEFDTVSTKNIKFVTTDQCGNNDGFFQINASEFCTLWTNASEAYCKAVSAFNTADAAYCLAYKSYNGGSSYCGSEDCSCGYCFDDIVVGGDISLISSDGCGCIKLNYENYRSLYCKVYNSSSSDYCSVDYCSDSSSSASIPIIAYGATTDSGVTTPQ